MYKRLVKDFFFTFQDYGEEPNFDYSQLDLQNDEGSRSEALEGRDEENDDCSTSFNDSKKKSEINNYEEK